MGLPATHALLELLGEVSQLLNFARPNGGAPWPMDGLTCRQCTNTQRQRCCPVRDMGGGRWVQLRTSAPATTAAGVRKVPTLNPERPAARRSCGPGRASAPSRCLMESDVRELLVEELRDAYSAEKQALRCMQKSLKWRVPLPCGKAYSCT
jgi:hypothetical protein